MRASLFIDELEDYSDYSDDDYYSDYDNDDNTMVSHRSNMLAHDENGEDENIADVDDGLLGIIHHQKTSKQTRSQQKKQLSKQVKKSRKQKQQKQKTLETLSSSLSENATAPQKELTSEELYRQEMMRDQGYLNQVDFGLNVKESLKMHVTNAPFSSVTTFTQSEEYVVEKQKYFREYYDKHRVYPHGKLKSGIQAIPFCEKVERKNRPNFIGLHSYAAVSHMGKIFVHGGLDERNNRVGEFWSYNPSNGAYVLYRYSNIDPLLCDGHKMVVVGGHLLLIAPSLSLYSYDSVMTVFRIRVDEKKKKVYFTHFRSVDNYIPPLKYFTATLCGNSVYLFGGFNIKTKQCNANLYEITPDMNRQTVSKVRIDTKCEFQPSPRYGHAAVAFNGTIAVVGGRDVDRMFSDVCIYDPTSNAWTEMNIDGCGLPPISHHAVVATSSDLIIVGGITLENKPISNVYKYEYRTNKWYIMKMMGHSEEQQIISELRPMMRHDACMVGNKLFCVGGLIDTSTIKQRTDTIVVINEFMDSGNDMLIFDYLKQQRDEAIMADVLFVLKRNVSDEEKTSKYYEEEEQIPAHKCIVCARSPHLMSLVQEAEDNLNTYEGDYGRSIFDSQMRDENAIIVRIDNTTSDIFHAVLDFIYCGRIYLKGEKQVEEFLRITREWDLYPDVIDKICSKAHSTTLQNSSIVLDHLTNDMGKLINNQLCSDVVLLLGEEQEVRAHRLILCRSVYFKRMFSSGMQEAVEGVVDLGFMDQGALSSVLNFMYTDRIDVDPANCVGVLVYAHLFALSIVSDYCRGMIAQNLTIDNVLSVFEIADLYKVSSLKRSCLKFIREHYQQITTSRAWPTYDKLLQSEIGENYVKFNKRKLNKSLGSSNRR